MTERVEPATTVVRNAAQQREELDHGTIRTDGKAIVLPGQGQRVDRDVKGAALLRAGEHRIHCVGVGSSSVSAGIERIAERRSAWVCPCAARIGVAVERIEQDERVGVRTERDAHVVPCVRSILQPDLHRARVIRAGSGAQHNVQIIAVHIGSGLQRSREGLPFR